MNMYLIDMMGWAGALGILAAYYWSSSNKVNSTNGIFKYQLMNILGAIGLLVNSFYYGAVPSVILNLVWVVIAVHSLIRLPQENRKAMAVQKA